MGHSPQTHFSLSEDACCSRLHCLVEINPPLCRLVDLNRHNGTLVNASVGRPLLCTLATKSAAA